ncbi:Rieske 2Fe-2S domain-containing protein [Paraliomyxa miuraensis]|uniref:Rieske 2Fe-2S domain-containing protein n=1 Tax=Paraliomyxa miuraensis TaxID=376150 RepID=UPI00225AEF97|nr:Rieske 2Fe-2S domain-containing protein [Paraliomyxa miuraensis]MCX4242035.1 Rieske 2Fe-2S domain-containing protein [Paraliomyxa miuraensis]
MAKPPRPSAAVRERSYPPPFPDGWYRVAGSHELRPGAILYRECLGAQMIVYRGENGRAQVMSAFCPHMGANLAGGCVKGDRVECPFHLWQLAPDGSVAHVPYADKLPRARHRIWATRERYGQIFIYHRGAQIDAPPPYDIPSIADIDDGRMVYRGRYDAGSVHMHLLEFGENSVDFQHFSPLHGQMFVPWTRLRVPGVQIQHEADWEDDPEHGHVVRFKNHSTLRILGKLRPETRGDSVATFWGPAGIVMFRITIPKMGDILFFQTHLPVQPLEQRVWFHWFADVKMPRWLVYYVVGNWISQWRNDLDVWENKVHLRKPLLVKGDGPIHRLRKWWKQFYPEGVMYPGDEADDGGEAERAAE